MSNWAVKRPEHRNWPQPAKSAKSAKDSITILAA